MVHTYNLRTPVKRVDLACREPLDSSDMSPPAIVAAETKVVFHNGAGSESGVAQFRCEWHLWLEKLLKRGHITLYEMFRTAALADSFITREPGVTADVNTDMAKYLFPSCLGIAQKFEGNVLYFKFRTVRRLVYEYTDHEMLKEEKLQDAELYVLKRLEYQVAGSTVLSSFLEYMTEHGVDVHGMVVSSDSVSTARFLHVTKDIMFSMEAMDHDLRETATRRAASLYISFLGIA